MGSSRRPFTWEFNSASLQRMERAESLAALTRALEINANLLQRRRQEFRASPGSAFPGQGQRCAEHDRVAQLERMIRQQALEIDCTDPAFPVDADNAASTMQELCGLTMS